MLAPSTNKSLSNGTFLTAWILLSLGGSGLHITGFHFTNLYQGDGKTRASAGISAAFGASSAIFPIIQLLNQFANISVQDLAKFYSVIVSCILVNNLFVKVRLGLGLGFDTCHGKSNILPCVHTCISIFRSTDETNFHDNDDSMRKLLT